MMNGKLIANKYYRRYQAGVALITAILVTALASVMAVAMVTHQQLDIRRTGNIIDSERAYVFALGIEAWASQWMLSRDPRDKDSLDEGWAIGVPAMTVEDAKVAGHLEDLQGRFNINNLVKPDSGKQNTPEVERFKRLLEAFEINTNVANAVIDWIDSDQDTTFPDGAEDSEYMAQPTPYRAANMLMVSPSELLLVKGITPEIYAKLAPHVSALPVTTHINVNTATVPVIMALADGITAADAQMIIDTRGQKGFKSIAEFTQLPMLKNRPGLNAGINITSNYFLVDANATLGAHGKMRLFAVIERRQDKVAVLMRGQGVY